MFEKYQKYLYLEFSGELALDGKDLGKVFGLTLTFVDVIGYVLHLLQGLGQALIVCVLWCGVLQEVLQ